MTYESIKVDVQHGVATVAIDNPPLNLLDGKLFPDLMAFVARYVRTSRCG